MGRSKQLYALTGVLGMTDGMDTNTQYGITEDADGSTSGPNWVVDVSEMLSRRIGKQMSQMATYRVKGFRVSIVNQDDANDNNYGITCNGSIDWYTPTSHRIDALQYARQYKKDLGGSLASDANDPFAPWRTTKEYKGLRFNWSEDGDGVHGATDDDTSILSGTQFSMSEIFDHYNNAISGTPLEEGYTQTGSGSALWVSRTGESQTDGISWEASFRNSAYQDGLLEENAWSFEPESMPFDFMLSNNHFDVLGGLLVFRLKGTNTENPRAGDVDDHYRLRFTVFVEGWEGF